MKVKTIIPHVGEHGKPAGLVLEVAEEIGELLISKGIAEKAPKNAKVTEDK
jgi:hypothetical protein